MPNPRATPRTASEDTTTPESRIRLDSLFMEKPPLARALVGPECQRPAVHGECNARARVGETNRRKFSRFRALSLDPVVKPPWFEGETLRPREARVLKCLKTWRGRPICPGRGFGIFVFDRGLG